MNAKRLLVLMLLVLLAACEEKPAVTAGFAGLGQASEAFATVSRGRPLVFPQDHAAHDGYRIEWWYVTANLTDEQGREWGAQWTLFRTALRPGEEQVGWNSPNVWMGHAGLTSPWGHQHTETLARGGIGQAGVQAEPFRAWIDNWSLHSSAGAGLQNLHMQASGKQFSYALQLSSKGPLVAHGDQGYSEKSGQGQASYYFSQPFFQVTGEVQSAGQRFKVTGNAWLDREWSSQPLAADQQGWDWFSLHLQNGAKLMLFQVRQAQGDHYRAGTWISAEGVPTPLDATQIKLTPVTWTVQQHGRKVPTAWRVEVPEHAVDVQVAALQPQAWMATLFPYWEGPVSLSGSLGGRGFLEMTGY